MREGALAEQALGVGRVQSPRQSVPVSAGSEHEAQCPATTRCCPSFRRRGASVSRSAWSPVYRGRQPSSSVALLVSMITGWLIASIHSAAGGMNGARGMSAAARAAPWVTAGRDGERGQAELAKHVGDGDNSVAGDVVRARRSVCHDAAQQGLADVVLVDELHRQVESRYRDRDAGPLHQVQHPLRSRRDRGGERCPWRRRHAAPARSAGGADTGRCPDGRGPRRAAAARAPPSPGRRTTGRQGVRASPRSFRSGCRRETHRRRPTRRTRTAALARPLPQRTY